MKRSRTVVVITMLVAMLLLLVMAVPAMAADTKTAKPLFEDSDGPEWVDGTYMLGDKETAFRQLTAKVGAEAMISNANTAVVGAPAAAVVGQTFTVDVSNMDPDHAGVYTETFVVQSVGEHGIICITQAAYNSYDGAAYYFANPNGDDSEPWLRTQDVITPGQLSYMLGTFDTTIWDTMSATFGTPLARGEEGQKVWILILNIIDEAYYDPTADSYVAGYFSSAEDYENNKNMMHIDTYDWANRIGGDSARPYLYEGVFAHEYQHLLHADSDSDEESWVDEGMADLAAFLCGFMEDNGHVISYIQYHPYTALTFFGGNLSDYGAVYLFQLYLWENFGGDAFTTALFHDQANGIEGVQNQLDAFGGGVAFDKVFDDWTLANYFDGTCLAPYGYDSVAIGPDTEGWTIPYMLDNYYNPWSLFPYNPALLLPLETPGWWFYYDYFGYGMPQRPYAVHYYLFNPYSKIAVTVDGEDTAGVSAYDGDLQMVSGVGTWAWKSFYQSFTVPASGTATLDFYTWYEIEPDWDYGYVEIYDSTAGEWYTMPVTDDAAAVITTTTFPNVQESDNVPDAQEPATYVDLGRWNGLTGASYTLLNSDPDGWIHGNVDLSPFYGHDITIYFRTWQDGAFTYQMMYVDNVTVTLGATTYFADFEDGMDGWATPAAADTDAWLRSSGQYANDWEGTLVKMYQAGAKKRHSSAVSPAAPMQLQVYHAAFDQVDQTGTVKAQAASNQRIVNWLYILSNRADHILTSDYYLEAWSGKYPF